MKFKKSLSIALAMAMALCCVCLPAFAEVQDGTTTMDLSDAQIVEAADWASLVDEDAPVAMSDEEIMPLSRGSLAPNKLYIDTAISLTEGEVITVYGNWSPSTASVSIGLWDHANNAGLMKPVSNGNGSATFRITKSGLFSVAIANTSAVSITWNTSYVIA